MTLRGAPYPDGGTCQTQDIRGSLVVPVQKPFTPGMWAKTVLYNGFVVWLTERKHHPEFTRGTKFNQFGSMVSLAFAALFSLLVTSLNYYETSHRVVDITYDNLILICFLDCIREKLHSNLSRMTMVVWFFMALIITQSYTASLTTLLTHQRSLNQQYLTFKHQRNGEKVGCDVVQYLQDVLHFDPPTLSKYIQNRSIITVLVRELQLRHFLRFLTLKVFLAKYCNKFTTGPTTYHVGGFRFVSYLYWLTFKYINTYVT